MYDKYIGYCLLILLQEKPKKEFNLGKSNFQLVTFADTAGGLESICLASYKYHNDFMPNWFFEATDEGINFTSSGWYVYGVDLTDFYAKL